MIDIDPALRSTLGFHIGYEKDSMHAKLAGTLRQIGNFGEGMVPEPRPKLANFTYSCQPSIEARCGLQINSKARDKEQPLDAKGLASAARDFLLDARGVAGPLARGEGL